MNTKEMLERLQYSKNEGVAEKAKRILAGNLDPEEEIKYCGSFFKAVLSGDFAEALSRADALNYRALTDSDL